VGRRPGDPGLLLRQRTVHQENLSLLVVGIILLSLVPMIIGVCAAVSAAPKPKPTDPMWSLSAWRRRRILARHPIADDMWQRVRHHLSFLDGISAAEDQWLREACVLFLEETPDRPARRRTASGATPAARRPGATAAAEPGRLNWYQGFHEIILYPDDFSARSAIAMPAASSMSGTASTAAKPGNRARSSSPGPG
jgi:hypothetical protein